MPRSETSTPIMFYYVYVLQSTRNDHLYIGYATNLKERLKEHNRGRAFATRPYRPWMLIHFEAYRDKKDAERREKYLKTTQGYRLLKRMLKEYFYSKRN